MNLAQIKADLKKSDKYGHGCDGCGCACCSALSVVITELELLKSHIRNRDGLCSIHGDSCAIDKERLAG